MLATAKTTLNTDIHRPRYHFLPAANWMNDPNGVIQWDGRYHLFFQYNPHGACHANIHWGHAVSDDLVHWQELPVAIAPTPNSPDRGGVFSGCMVNDNGKPTAIYTGVNETYDVQAQCLAAGSPDLTTWEKYAGNPIVGDVPAELGQTRDFRDPFVWRGPDCWYMILASHIAGVGGAVLLYRSSDLRRWQYLHPLYVGDRARNGVNFECPNFFPLGDKWVLIVSSQPAPHTPGATLCFVGRLENQRFIPESEAVYDAGCSYASLCHQDDSGRWLIYSWIREGRSVDQQLQAGWAGVQAIPRVLSLDPQNRLISDPVPELEKLRRRHQRFPAGALDEAGLSLQTLSLDICAEFAADQAARSGIKLTCAGVELAIIYDRNTATLQVQRRCQRDEPQTDSAPQGIVHTLNCGETLQLRVLVDGSLAEVIANGRARITSRFYPLGAEGPVLRPLAPSSLISLDVWELSTIWQSASLENHESS